MDEIRFVQLEPTTRCNLTCGYCCGRQMPQADLDFSTFKATLTAFPRLTHLELQGEGEPLLHPKFFEMVAYARSLDIKVSFITNGTLLSPSNVEHILQAGVEKVSISIDSIQPSVFKMLRGGNVDKVKDGIRRLIDTRRARALERPAVALAVTVVRTTVGDIPEIVSFYNELGLDGGISTQVLNPMECYTNTYAPELAGLGVHQSTLDEYLREVATRPDAHKALHGHSTVHGFFDELFADFVPGQGRCSWLERGAYVNFQGFVTGCCMIKDVEHWSYGQIDSPVDNEVAATLASAGARLDFDGLRSKMRAQLAAGEIPQPCRGCSTAALATGQKPRQTIEARVEVVEVQNMHVSNGQTFHSLDSPGVGEKKSAIAFPIAGWFASPTADVISIEIEHEGKVLRRVPADIPRPDVTSRPQLAWVSPTCGFWTVVEVSQYQPACDLKVVARLSDGQRVPFGEIRLKSEVIQEHFHLAFSPTGSWRNE